MATATAEIITTEQTALTTAQAGRFSQSPVMAYLAGMATARARTVQLQALAAMTQIISNGASNDPLALDWAALRYSHAQAIRTALAERYAAATANRFLSALRGVIKAAFLLGLMAAEDYQRVVMVKAVTGSTVPAGRAVTRGELNALKANCESDPTPAGARDKSILAILYTCGLRRAELVGLQLANYDPTNGALLIHGKRNKERITYVKNGTDRALASWLIIRGNAPGALFCAINKGGRLIHEPMTAQALYNLLAKRAQAAGVKDFSPHDMRRTYCGDMLENGQDIANVAKLMGHASVNTTARYDRRPESAKEKAQETLHF